MGVCKTETTNVCILVRYCIYVRQLSRLLTEFSAGINRVARWSFFLFYVRERGRRQDGESAGKNYNFNPSTIETIRSPTYKSYILSDT